MKLEIQQTAILINDSENMTQQQIQEIATNEPYKLLGVATCMNGNTEPQKIMLQEKINKLTRMFRFSKLNHFEAKIGLQNIAYPMIKYGLNATAINWEYLETIQAPLTHAILPRLGYNRHMPRAIVYAPI
jgi:hypothetical protein